MKAKKPLCVRKLRVHSLEKKSTTIRFYATEEMVTELREFGQIEAYPDYSTYYNLLVSPLYDFDEVAAYLRELAQEG